MIETSIIIPTYNRLSFLKEAVESVLNQTYQDFELILVDDGSTDGTKEFAAGLSSRLKYVYQENSGPSAARNRGISESHGEFITFLDSDDLWLENKLQVEIDFLKANREAMVCYTDEIWIRKGVRVNPKNKHRKYSGWIFEQCLPLCIVSPSSVLMKREFFESVGYFDETLPACEDYDLWLRAALKLPFHFIPRKLIMKRGGHADQLSTQWGLDRYRVQALLKLLENEELDESQHKWVVEKVIEKAAILEQGFRKHGKEEEADFYKTLTKKFTEL
jgi:glycosyltransferase involved in cell wall biosynthesis